MDWFRFILCFFLSAAATYAGQSLSAQPSHPDVFLVTIDTLRADHVHCYGYALGETPAIDRLAEDGVRFTNAFTPSPITNSSHTTILTGLLPSAHGVKNFGDPLDSSHPTMASVLKAAGYKTAAFIGAVVLDSNTLAPGLDQGFDFYDNFPLAKKNSSRWGRVERRGKDVVARAEKWLDQHPSGPRFVWVHLYDPHDPYDPPAPYSRKFAGRLYDGEVAYADSAVADFVAYLKLHHSYSQALIIVVGDHGEGLGEHGEDTHGIFLYDSTTHVPLLAKLPGSHTGAGVIDIQVSTTDILPTVLDVAGVAKPASVDGQSLKPNFDGQTTVTQPLFGETDYPLSFGWAPLRSVREPGRKFIEAPRPEFYDLQADPGELHNTYQPWNPELQKMREKLAAHREKYPAHAASKSMAAVGTGTTQELQALGYLGPADERSSSTVSEPSLLADPKDKIAEQNLSHAAMLAVDDGRVALARAALEKVLVLDADSPAALVQLAQLELNAADYKGAAAHYSRARVAHPDDATLALNHGEALIKLGDLSGTKLALEASLKANPNQYRARFLLGSTYFSLREFTAAQDQLEAALLIQATPEAQQELGKVFLALNKFEEAREQFESAIKVESASSETYELLARAYDGLGNTVMANRARSRAKLLSSHTGHPPGNN